MPLVGRIQHLKCDDSETGGTVTLRTGVDGRMVSVAAVMAIAPEAEAPVDAVARR